MLKDTSRGGYQCRQLDIFVSEDISVLHANFDTRLALEAEKLEDVAKVLQPELRMAATALVGAAVFLHAVHRLLAAILVAADVDHKTVLYAYTVTAALVHSGRDAAYRNGCGQLERWRGQLARAQETDLAVHEFLQATLAEYAAAHAVTPPVGLKIRKVLQAAFRAAALDVTHVRE